MAIELTSSVVWTLFIAFVVAMLLLDLLFVHREKHEVHMKEALLWSGFWIGLALCFNGGIGYFSGKESALNFFTGYLVELSLSADNLFVFLLLFSYFKIPNKYQREVLFWGVLGAIVMRALFIFAGIALLQRFDWLIYLFGGILIVSGLKMFRKSHGDVHPERNIVLRLLQWVIPIDKDYEGEKFFVKHDGKWWATRLFVVLIAVETTDLIFAVDSIPAILAITTDPFIVFSSNVFAIMGLRSFYFALASLTKLFRYLGTGLAFILIFIGGKMVFHHVLEIPIALTLGITVAILAISVGASMVLPQRAKT